MAEVLAQQDDPDEKVFDGVVAEWDAMSHRHRSVLSIKRYFFFAACDASEKKTAALTQRIARLEEALRGLSVRFNHKDEKCPECFCNAWDWTKHTEPCKAARTALKGEE